MLTNSFVRVELFVNVIYPSVRPATNFSAKLLLCIALFSVGKHATVEKNLPLEDVFHIKMASPCNHDCTWVSLYVLGALAMGSVSLSSYY